MARLGARASVAACAALAVFLVAIAPSARADQGGPQPLQTGSDWAMYGASAAHNFSTGATPPNRLGLVWSLTGNTTLGSPVVADGYAYVPDLDAGGQNLVIHKVSAINGTTVWNGSAAWTNRTPLGPGASAFAPSRSLAVAGSRTYALITAKYATDYQEVLVAVDNTQATNNIVWWFNGTTRWTSASPNATRSAPALAGGLAIFGSQDGNVYAVSATDGSLAWWFPTGAPVQTVPAVYETIVYVTSGMKLFFLDIQGLGNGDQGIPDVGHTGDEVFEVAASAPITASPVVADPYVYLDVAGDLWAIDRTFAGAPVWSANTSWQGEGTPALLGDTILARRSDARVYAFDRLTGQVLWVRAGLPAPAGGEDLVAVNGRAYLSAQNGTGADLVTLDGTDGAVLERNTTTPRPALGAPIAAGDFVYVTEGTRLLAYRGQPDLEVLPTGIVFSGGSESAGSVMGNLTIVVRNVGDEPASNVRVHVYDGADIVANLTLGTPKPIKAGGLGTGYTPDRAWAVGKKHEIHVVVDPAPTETNTANNEAVTLLFVQAGPPPPPTVVGSGPYWAALLLGFGAGAGILYLPLRRLRDVRRREEAPEPMRPSESSGRDTSP